MEDFEENQYYKPGYSNLFNKIKDIKTPVKNEILMALLDGQWHSELELIRVTKKTTYFCWSCNFRHNDPRFKSYHQKQLSTEKDCKW